MQSNWLPTRVEEGFPEGLLVEADSRAYKALIDNLYDGVYFVNRDRIITYWNRGAERLTGYTRDEIAGRQCFDNILDHIDEAGRCLCVDGCPLRATLEDGEPREMEVYLRHKQGHRVPVLVRATCIRDALGSIVGAVEIFSDIAAKKQVERRALELERMAFRDGLTGVASRRYAELRLAQMMEDMRLFGRSVGVMLIDVDNFKSVNDTWGHDVGDGVLCAVSRTLTRSLRHNDIVGRWGGEEFLVILIDADLALVEKIAERCRVLIGTSDITILDWSVTVTVSVGATLLLACDSERSAVNRADSLLYASKIAGRNRITVG